MIQKARSYELAFLQSKYSIDKFHNPYLSKFTLKITPTLNQKQKTTNSNILISPFSASNKIYLSQSLPIYKSQKFRTSLIWKQSLTKKMGRAFIGLSSEYKTDDMWNIKMKTMFGSIYLYNLQATKKLNTDTEVIFYHHGMYDSNMVSPLVGIGGRKKEFSATIHRRFGLDYNSVLQYTKPLPNNLYFIARTEVSVGENIDPTQMSQTNSLTLDYYFDKTIKARAGVSYITGQNQVSGKIEVQKQIKQYGNMLLSFEYRNNSSIVSFRYKNPTLNLILPVLAVDSPIPALIAVIVYGLGYFYRKKGTQKIQLKKKQQQVRINELKLISDKANINYEKQRNSGQRGLLIQQAYVGPPQLINKLQALAVNRGLAILRDNQLKQNVFDITMCLRFYVIKGELRLKKGQKNHLLGFYCKNYTDQMLVVYEKNQQKKTIRVKMSDQIIVK